MKKLKAIFYILFAKEWICITRRGDTHSIEFSTKYKYPRIGTAHYYADLLIMNTKWAITTLRKWAVILEHRLYHPDEVL